MKSVIKGTGYILAHTPDMVHAHNGTTQTTERIVNPDSEYLKELPKHLSAAIEQALAYWPNQVYIGNKTPEDLAADSSSRSGARRARTCPVSGPLRHPTAR
jgi:N12 class adenine-specific DNA methylase